MVLRKMLDRLRSRGEPKNGSEEPEKKNGIRKASKKSNHLPPPQHAADVPNYMKSTSSYDARKEKNKVTNSSLKLLRASVKKNKGTNLMSPNVLDLNEHHDASEPKICDYAYCSLHGHKHGAAPSLKRLVSARRRSLKVHKSIKLRGYSSIKKKGGNRIELVEDAVNELFFEIHSKFQEWCEERRSEDAESQNIVSRMCKMKLEDPNDASELQESCSVTSIEDCGDKSSDLSMEDVQIINQFLEFIGKGWQEETRFETEQREFNPCLPRLQAETEPEQVNLKHQSVDERKAAEEWMVDFALRKALTRLASVRKKKVPQLVAAFETVMPQMSKKSYP